MSMSTPEEIRIQAALEQLSKDDLQTLIQRMVQQHPDLAGLIVSGEQEAVKKPREPFNAEFYRHQVIEIFRIYQRYVEMRIEWRGRDNYRTACQYLLSIRRLYQKMDQSNEWTTYVTGLRERNAKLPALRDEMAKAKL